ncbi:LysR family transcriptional regulator [Comamonas antarctica]|uniref:LysR family transcriptional regulator n=1 Tax=Comamonas antarctica TaxID=2743470 RepID=A0A6N1X7G0_9BURK|nr:LysR family transcriptional regulator [Comamonas antarctica]QKV55329.1 LysR family transcriptional regulator [Comamonas antarctica]
MPRENLNDLLVFFAVAQDRSFTRAAARLGVSQSALSHTIRGLEERMGVRLLSRTTRSMSPTDAGERLLQRVAPRLDEIERELAAVRDMGERPSGNIRITAIDYVLDTVVWPRLAPVLSRYPDVRVEFNMDYRLVDIAADRFDIGVRFGDQVDKDMVAVRLTPDVQQTIVAAPDYFKSHSLPTQVQDLARHNCIPMKLHGGGIYAWELLDGGRPVEVRIDGQVTFNGAFQMLNAALDGYGLAFLPEELTRLHIEAGRLVSVMAACCPKFPGLHAYYASQRHSSRALRLVIDALRMT